MFIEYEVFLLLLSLDHGLKVSPTPAYLIILGYIIIGFIFLSIFGVLLLATSALNMKFAFIPSLLILSEL